MKPSELLKWAEENDALDDHILLYDDNNKSFELLDERQLSECDGNLVINKTFNFKKGDIYYSMGILISTGEVYIAKIVWDGGFNDCVRRAAGIIYRSEDEAKEHLLADYNRLTGENRRSIKLME
jgi:hypothetical protein